MLGSIRLHCEESEGYFFKIESDKDFLKALLFNFLVFIDMGIAEAFAPTTDSSQATPVCTVSTYIGTV